MEMEIPFLAGKQSIVKLATTTNNNNSCSTIEERSTTAKSSRIINQASKFGQFSKHDDELGFTCFLFVFVHACLL